MPNALVFFQFCVFNTVVIMRASNSSVLLLGVDGGGTRCRARLTSFDGSVLGEGLAGPANIRFGVQESLAAVGEATAECLRQAGLGDVDDRIVACLALAGASEPVEAAAAQAYAHSFRRAIVTTDAEAACMGAHGGEDGGIVIVGTGSVGWANVAGQRFRVGGWGFPLSDEGSGAWLGAELLRRTLWAVDGLIPWSGVLQAAVRRFDGDPHHMVRWMGSAWPRDYASFAPLIVEHAARGDTLAHELMRRGGAHVERMAMRLFAFGAPRVALMGGLADKVEPYLSADVRNRLSPPLGDALSGALHLARTEAERLVTVDA